MVKEFHTAAKAVADPEDWIEFNIVEDSANPGEPPKVVTCRAITEPSDGQVAFVMARTTKHMSTQEKVGAILNFLDSTLDDESQVYISNRMLDPKDAFGASNVMDILSYLMEEWSGRPTRSSTASIPPPPPTGPWSTPPTPVSTY